MASLLVPGTIPELETTDHNLSTLLRRCPRNLQPTYFERIVVICQALHAWWSTLSPDVQNPTPSSPNFRSNAHLKLCLYLNDIFVGRPFIFSQTTTGITPEATAASPEQTRRPTTSGKSPSPAAQSVPERPRNRAALVERAVEAAISTIALLRTLHETTGLARSSYTEFSSCRAALLVMLAQSVVTPAPGSGAQQTQQPSQQPRLKAAVEMGMKLIRRMAAGNNVSTQSEASIIEALETAVRRLHAMQDARGVAGGVPGEGRGETFVEINVRGEMDVGKTGYERFKEWASMWPATAIGGGGGGEPQQPQHQHRHLPGDDPMGGLKRLDGRPQDMATVPSPYPGMPSGPGVLGPPPELVEHSPDSARWMAIMDNAGLRMEQLDDLSLFGGFPELGALDGWPGVI